MDFCCHRWTLLVASLACLTLFGSLLNHWPSLRKMSLRPALQVIINTTNTTVLVWYWPFASSSSVQGNV